MKATNLILFFSLIIIFSSSVYSLDENNEIKTVQELITLVNSKEFEDFLEHEDDDINPEDEPEDPTIAECDEVAGSVKKNESIRHTFP